MHVQDRKGSPRVAEQESEKGSFWRGVHGKACGETSNDSHTSKSKERCQVTSPRAGGFQFRA